VPPSRTDTVPIADVRPEVRAIAADDPALAARMPGSGHHTLAEAVHACSHQGALDLDDVLSRRTRVAIEVPDRGRAAAAAIAPLVAPVLGWSDARAADEVARYVRLRDAEAAAEAAPDDATARERYRAVLDGGGTFHRSDHGS
jgi:glycerol-3-phosphate dehydrogenase